MKNKITFGIVIVELLIIIVGLLNAIKPQNDIITGLQDFYINEYNGIVYNEEENFYQIKADWGAADALISKKKCILPGAYRVSVEYESTKEPQNPQYNVEDVTGHLAFESDRSKNSFVANNILLSDGKTHSESIIWVKRGAKITDFVIKVSYYGQGNLTIKNIVIEEQIAYRYIKLLGLIIGILLLDYVGYIIFEKEKNQLITFAVLLGVNVPILADYIYKSDDINYHLGRIVAIANSLGNGQFPVRMNQEMILGYGYPSAIFYNPILLYIPALLYMAAVPLFRCYQIYIVCINVGTFYIANYSFGKIVKNKQLGYLGAILYLFAAYRLVNIYNRAAVGEYSAMVFFPLIIYGFWKIYETKRPKLEDCIPILIGVTGVLGSHLLSTILVAEAIFVFCLLCWKKTFQLCRLSALLKSLVCIFILNMYWIIPFIQSYSMNIRVNSEGNTLVGSGLNLIQLLNVFDFLPGQYTNIDTEYLPMSIGVTCLLSIGLYIYILVNEREQIKGNVALNISIGLGGLFVFFSSNLFPWYVIEQFLGRYANIVKNVQFAWRYMALATPLLILAFLLEIKVMLEVDDKRKIIVIISLVIGLMGISVSQSYTQLIENGLKWYVYSETDMAAKKNIGLGDYLLEGTDLNLTNRRMVQFDSDKIESAYLSYVNGVSSIEVHNDDGIEHNMDVPIFNYDNYHAVDGKGTYFEIINGENNKIRLKIPPHYEGVIAIYYKEPTMWRICEVMSVFAFMLMGGFIIRTRRKVKGQEVIDA